MTSKTLKQLLSQGKISRRDFIRLAAALGITSAFAGPLAATESLAANPRKGGRFRMGLIGSSTSSTLDPSTNVQLMDQLIGRQLHSNLIEVSPEGKLIPELALSWEPSEKASKWVIKLRKDVEFHNGKTMDVEDVIYTINYHRDEKSKSVIKSLLNQIAEIKADGKDTLIVKLKTGNADFSWLLTDIHFLILPKDSDPNSGVGTGGYVIEEHEPGVRTVVKRFPNYFKENAAFFDEVENVHIGDPNARTAAITTGQVDYISRVDTRIAKRLEKKPNIEVLQYGGTIHYTFPMLTDTKPFDDNNLRLALKHAIDREKMLETILGGYGYVGNDHPIPPFQKYCNKNLPQRQYDPDKARYYLKKAGHDKIDLTLHAADVAFNGAVDAVVLYQQSAAKAGINIVPKRMPNDGYWKNVWKKKGWTACYWTARPTPDWTFSMIYAAGAPNNDTHWKHKRFNELLLMGRVETDEQKRKEIYGEMQEQIRDEGGAVIPMFAYFLDAIGDKVGYSKIGNDWEADDFRIHERMWFKS
jgi:peptide/nickel transport system substrate-binding protein